MPFILFNTGFNEYHEVYVAYPNTLLCVDYICDVGHVIVNGTEPATQQPSTHNASHHNLCISDIHYIEKCENSNYSGY